MTATASQPARARQPHPTQQADLSTYVFGKLQPQALPLEEAVLGALMIERDALPQVLDILRPESFYLEAHGLIYAAIVRLFSACQPVDILTVGEELKKSGDLDKIGGSYYLVELSSRVASAANIEYHARVVAEKALLREIIRLSSVATQAAYQDDADAFDLLSKIEGDLFAVSGRMQRGRGPMALNGLATQALRQAADAAATPGGLVGVPCGLTSIDRITGGWRAGDLIILAGRPGMGKTSLAVDMALNAARDFSRPALVFSLEMSAVQVAGRIVSAASEVNGNRMRNGQASERDFARMEGIVTALADVPLYIDETAGINAFEIMATTRRMVQKHGVQVVVVDYLQLIGSGPDRRRGQSRNDDVGEITRALKLMAKELGVAVICLSQLSRAVETRGGSKRPQLSDLRDSGNIEQDSDIVAFIYRPEYYQITEDGEGRSLEGVAEFIIAKHRSGPLDTVRLKFIDELTHFCDAPGSQFPTSFTPAPAFPRSEPGENVPF